jgi:hypothetical protein
VDKLERWGDEYRIHADGVQILAGALIEDERSFQFAEFKRPMNFITQLEG